MAKQRISLVGVPVDICSPQDLESEILELLAKPGTKQIVFLSIWNLLRARRKNAYAECIRKADLIIPVSRSILSGAKFLHLSAVTRMNPFHTVINILSVLDAHFKSLYILGGHKKSLSIAERNVRSTFPGLQLVGRYRGYFSQQMESNIVQAIYKASPSLVLLSDGVKEKDCWPYNRRNRFSSSIFLYYKDAIGIFSDTKKRIKDSVFEHGNEIWLEIVHNPLKIFLIFPYIWYILLLIWYKIFKK
ncbi:MAG: WecB/TagA/CpsF family glycosyltransferase [Treponema sp.]|jgi:N-acetylglucosaminyldiphosphoundecaprenol N-acetyl-beta-D-mannosaminyltransferase|nr:WecB/TagA/CpsF family glycosyltransferase [Treponema sp.]